MNQLRRKRDAFEPTLILTKNTKVKISTDIPKKSVEIMLERNDMKSKLQKSAIRAISAYSNQTLDITGHPSKLNLKDKLLCQEQQALLKNKDKKSPGILTTKSIFSEDEIKLYCQSKKVLKRDLDLESKLTKQCEGLLKVKNYTKELLGLDEESRNKLKNIIVSKTRMRSELETQLNEIRNMIEGYKNTAFTLKKLIKEKGSLNKSISECCNQLKSQIHKKETSLYEDREHLEKLSKKQSFLTNEISRHEDFVKINTLQLMKLNYEYFNENNPAKLLREQIHQTKGGIRTIGIFLPLNSNGRPFEFETYCKVQNQNISFINNDKFGTKPSISPLKKGRPDSTSYKWAYSTNSFSFDEIISENEFTSFYNYDYHQKLYSDLEIFLKMALYPNPDSILRKVSFNQPELLFLLNNQKLEKHHNINNFLNIEDPFFDEPVLNEFGEFAIQRLISTSNNIDNKENKATILFMGIKDLGLSSVLFKKIGSSLLNFSNDFIALNKVKVKIDYCEQESSKFALFDSFEEFYSFFMEKISPKLYQSLCTVSFLFEVQNKQAGLLYTRKLNLIFMDDPNIEYPDRFVRHLKAMLNREKIVTTIDKSLQKIEGLIKGVNRIITICELPKLIHKANNAEEEFNRLRIIVDIVSGMGK